MDGYAVGELGWMTGFGRPGTAWCCPVPPEAILFGNLLILVLSRIAEYRLVPRSS